MKQGMLVLLSGPSGIGKDVISDILLKDPQLQLFKSISVTTRPKRDHETDGKEYYFIDYPTFEEAVKNRELLEYQEFLGHHYGTPRIPEQFMRSLGKHVLVSVEAQGALQVKHEVPEALSFYLVPKDIDTLESMIRARRKEDDEVVKQRLHKANLEMKLGSIFQYEVPIEDPAAAATFIKEKILDFLGN